MRPEQDVRTIASTTARTPDGGERSLTHRAEAPVRRTRPTEAARQYHLGARGTHFAHPDPRVQGRIATPAEPSSVGSHAPEPVSSPRRCEGYDPDPTPAPAPRRPPPPGRHRAA